MMIVRPADLRVFLPPHPPLRPIGSTSLPFERLRRAPSQAVADPTHAAVPGCLFAPKDAVDGEGGDQAAWGVTVITVEVSYGITY